MKATGAGGAACASKHKEYERQHKRASRAAAGHCHTVTYGRVPHAVRPYLYVVVLVPRALEAVQRLGQGAGLGADAHL